MVLLIIGLTVSGLLGMAMSMMKSAEVRESTDKVSLLKDRIVGFALTNQRILQYVSGVTGDESTFLYTNNRDFWGQKLNYIYDSQLVQPVICGSKATKITIRNCTDIACNAGASNPEQSNIAFIVFSRGRNLVNQTGVAGVPYPETAPDPSISGSVSGSIATPTIIKIYPRGMLVGAYNAPSVDMVENDDIVSIVTLDELRQKLACQGTPLRIMNTDLPMGSQGAVYNSTIYADGGVPLSPSTSGKYRWCAESSIASATITAIAIPEAVTGGTGPAITIGAPGTCVTEPENSTTRWVQGDDFRLRGAGATPANSLPMTATAGTYDITVYVRDDQSANASPLAVPDPADNVISRRFILAISGS